ncbi:hypothetical protein BDR26DRAFT_901712 [Obelidium mucronatum]|nr:hypothetical protein BDR26DRAFT_901712 [Obelidium mucronatum]
MEPFPSNLHSLRTPATPIPDPSITTEEAFNSWKSAQTFLLEEALYKANTQFILEMKDAWELSNSQLLKANKILTVMCVQQTQQIRELNFSNQWRTSRWSELQVVLGKKCREYDNKDVVLDVVWGKVEGQRQLIIDLEKSREHLSLLGRTKEEEIQVLKKCVKAKDLLILQHAESLNAKDSMIAKQAEQLKDMQLKESENTIREQSEQIQELRSRLAKRGTGTKVRPGKREREADRVRNG